MRFKSCDDYSMIKFSSDITIENTPLRTYEYIVNGCSAIQWIMDPRLQ
ncbi:type ISP restriction/modification enzyme [Lacticaseibacillus paracasei]|uniref:Type ISP restriction-modification enzyme LLaBIII C-terminal specificity domain-containing protein n=1 Tax=Lacticaseibacillus paracasei TaxID=1597 RepID=A0AAW6A7I4_LACPA|nr:type ISP restriction/modification enzyme [Lacticaseibacillus paracasei]MDB1565159.1 hypothetical protein [Lacticaseibacillus paracasei]